MTPSMLMSRVTPNSAQWMYEMGKAAQDFMLKNPELTKLAESPEYKIIRTQGTRTSDFKPVGRDAGMRKPAPQSRDAFRKLQDANQAHPSSYFGPAIPELGGMIPSHKQYYDPWEDAI